MDLLEKGKSLARQGKHEEALDALLLALENDKENPDIHFFLGLCYSALEQYPYAKYHYNMVKVLQPDHPKLSLVWEGLEDVSPQKPPEKRMTRSAAAKAQKEGASEESEEPEEISPEKQEKIQNQEKKTGMKLSEPKWENAFSEDMMKTETTMSTMQKILILAVAAVLFGLLVYFIMNVFFNPAIPVS